MKFCVLLFFFTVICCYQSLAEDKNNLSLVVVGKKHFEAEPRGIVTTVYRISNNTDLKQKFEVKITLPKKWKIINPDHFYELDGNQQNVRLMSVFIPSTTTSGNYLISYQISTQSNPVIIRSFNVPVFVKPIRKVSLFLIDQPDYVIAGDSYQMKYRLINESNISTQTKISVNNKNNLSYYLKDNQINLAPGQSENFVINVDTDIEAQNSINNNLEVTAKLINNEEIQSGVLSSVEVIPRNLSPTQDFNTVPVYSTLRFVNQNQYSQLSGLQGEIVGKGFLNQSQTNQVNLILRGPDVYDKSIFGKYDEYLFSNSSDKYVFHIGDRPYYLSSLTQSYRFGRGIEGQLKHNNFKIGAYSMFSRFFQPEEKVFASFLEYRGRTKYRIRSNYMKKKHGVDESDIASVEFQLEPINNTKIQLEYALGKNQKATNHAYYFDIQSKLKNHTFRLKYIKADPEFAGYYSNVNFISAGGVFYLTKKLRLNAGIGQQKNDANVTAYYYFSSLNKFQRIGLSYQLNSTTYLNVGWEQRIRKDQLTTAKIDDFEKSFRFGISGIMNKISFQASFELAKTINNIISKSAFFQRYTTSLTFKPNSKHSFRSYVYYTNNEDPLRENNRNLAAGLSIVTNLTQNTKLGFTLQSFNNLTYSSIVRDMYELRVSQKLFINHEISFVGRHISYSHDPTADFSALIAEYRIPFGMPVSRKNIFGSLKGILYDIENNHPVSDAVIRLNKLSTVTNKKGEFKFPSLIPGKYILDLERSSIGLNRVTTESFPVEFLVAGKDKKLIGIEVTRAASVKGKVTLYRFKEEKPEKKLAIEQAELNLISKPENRYEQVSGLANLLVKLQRGKEIKRRVTDRLGRFNFSELSPGEWKLFVQKSGLPEHTFVQQDTIQFFINPGENEEIVIKVLPKKRPIHIIQDGGTILEESDNAFRKIDDISLVDSKKSGEIPKQNRDVKKEKGRIETEQRDKKKQKAGTISYTIKPGDWLSKIAKKYYGDMFLYNLIYNANKRIIRDPNLIYPGQIIQIPAIE